MFKKSRVKYIFLIFLMFLFLSSCGIKDNLTHIEDLNGEDNYELQTLNDSDLYSNKPRALMELSVSSNKDKNHNFYANKLSGVKIIFSFNAENNNVYRFKYKTETKSGNARYYVICDGKLVMNLELNQEKEIEITNLNGKVEFRVAAESGNVSIDINEL